MKRRGWDYLPVDDVGYVSPCDVALLPDESLREWVRRFEQVRYSGWRNHDGLWRRELGLDTTTGKHEADGYEKFVEVMDAVGSHADWYNEEKLRMLADGLFTVRRFAYITNDGRYCAAVLDPVR